MAIYRVRDGMRFGAGKAYGPGDLVELDEASAASFADLVEPVAETDVTVVRGEAEADETAPKGKKK